MCFVVLSFACLRLVLKSNSKNTNCRRFVSFATSRFITLIDVLQFCVLCLFLRSFVDFMASCLWRNKQQLVIFYVDDALIVCVFFLVAVSSRRVAHIRYIHTFIIIILWFRSWLLLCPLSLMPLKNIFVFRSDSFDSTQFFQECRVAQLISDLYCTAQVDVVSVYNFVCSSLVAHFFIFLYSSNTNSMKLFQFDDCMWDAPDIA